jgi:hypothetical protein
MSSKKEVRRKRRAQEEEQRVRKGWNPALVFGLFIAVAIALTLGAFAIFGDPSGPGEPPWEGAVWSPAHDHWH